jgi:hypothetical protein
MKLQGLEGVGAAENETAAQISSTKSQLLNLAAGHKKITFVTLPLEMGFHRRFIVTRNWLAAPNSYPLIINNIERERGLGGRRNRG